MFRFRFLLSAFFITGFLFASRPAAACLDCGIPSDKLSAGTDTLDLLFETYSLNSDVLSTRWQRPLFSERALSIYRMKKSFEFQPLSNQILYAGMNTEPDENRMGTDS